MVIPPRVDLHKAHDRQVVFQSTVLLPLNCTFVYADIHYTVAIEISQGYTTDNSLGRQATFRAHADALYVFDTFKYENAVFQARQRGQHSAADHPGPPVHMVVPRVGEILSLGQPRLEAEFHRACLWSSYSPWAQPKRTSSGTTEDQLRAGDDEESTDVSHLWSWQADLAASTLLQRVKLYLYCSTPLQKMHRNSMPAYKPTLKDGLATRRLPSILVTALAKHYRSDMARGSPSPPMVVDALAKHCRSAVT